MHMLGAYAVPSRIEEFKLSKLCNGIDYQAGTTLTYFEMNSFNTSVSFLDPLN